MQDEVCFPLLKRINATQPSTPLSSGHCWGNGFPNPFDRENAWKKSHGSFVPSWAQGRSNDPMYQLSRYKWRSRTSVVKYKPFFELPGFQASPFREPFGPPLPLASLSFTSFSSSVSWPWVKSIQTSCSCFSRLLFSSAWIGVPTILFSTPSISPCFALMPNAALCG